MSRSYTSSQPCRLHDGSGAAFLLLLLCRVFQRHLVYSDEALSSRPHAIHADRGGVCLRNVMGFGIVIFNNFNF
jgi:hypothetical protein